MSREKLCVLGATGSIGDSTLALLALHPERFAVHALSAHRNIHKLFERALQFKPQFLVVGEKEDAYFLQKRLKEVGSSSEVLYGKKGLVTVASDPAVDTVVCAVVGSAGAEGAFAAAHAGKKILLANKETLVVAGELFFQVVKKTGARVYPIDSEHNAIFQVLPEKIEDVDEIILTASGGPFLHTPLSELEKVSVTQALSHPNWKMGKKISIDSATMMNKALEVIEAHFLFTLPKEKIKVIVHSESIVHSLVRLKDGSLLAQMGIADMRVPIAYSLSYPERMISGTPPLTLETLLPLHFLPVEQERFPALSLAYEVLTEKQDAGAILNAANEVAVDLFLQNKIKFTAIVPLVKEVLDKVSTETHTSLASVLAKDQQVREKTLEVAAGWKC
ncbi:MAG: 1-deoxy-D-xylulose-5-phosphate reductoisomerase [Haemophilus parainfluenzae]|jgi:1-deoxy-D-xylulose 5-phosphate reductoisomerase|nr:MAG: 1-deoxy-D-xylulose-5-phosphate reductoisomerase [Haemophilus parainfluenzae]